MIPEQIIEKAIAGGWGGFREKCPCDCFIECNKDGIAYRRKNEIEGDGVTYSLRKSWGNLDLFHLALDPDFWMALGKEMGWKNNSMCGCCGKTKEYCRCCYFEMYDKWKGKAMRFYDLILRKEDTAKFWENL